LSTPIILLESLQKGGLSSPPFVFQGTVSDQANIERLRTIIEPVCEDQGYDLCELSFAREQKGWVLRVYIDHLYPQQAGISFADCERLSRELSAVLDVADPVDSRYSLEVSSPGVDRPLRKLSHFQRFLGQEARLKLREALDGRKNFQGMLVSAEPDAIGIEVDGHTVRIPPDVIASAKLVPNWDALLKESSPERR
jgi:ribosome maturation factor RimP